MKKKVLYLAGAALLTVLLVVGGCAGPFDREGVAGSDEHGMVVLRFSDSRARSIVPGISLDIEYYEVSFTRTGFQPVTLTEIDGDVIETEPVRLLPGEWLVTVSSFNGAGTLIGAAQAPVSVAARQTATVVMAIESLEGDGTLSLSADLSELDLSTPAIGGTLISGAGETTDINMPIDGSSARFDDDIAAGTYLLTLELTESGTVIASYVNTVLIVFAETTSASLVFKPASGSIVVELLDEITRPIAIALEGLQDTLGTEQSMTVTAVTSVEVDSYQWYLDGEKLSGEVNEAITLGPGLLEGEYLLTVVVKKGEVYSAQAGEFNVAAAVYLPMVYVPGGTYQHDDDPDNTTTVSAYYISVYEITQAQYEPVTGENPSRFSDGLEAPDRPVERVNWYDALVFCNSLSTLQGRTPVYTINGSTNPAEWGEVPTSSNEAWDTAIMNMDANGYRLPTEAELMWAAMGAGQDAQPGAMQEGINRTGYAKPFAGYDETNVIDNYAWYRTNAYDVGPDHPDYGTHRVGTKLPNELGLHDMSGNVWHWTWDWSADRPSGPLTDPTGPITGTGRVLGGGSWANFASSCTVTPRFVSYAGNRAPAVGFRVVSR